jgi:hypothetical protein
VRRRKDSKGVNMSEPLCRTNWYSFEVVGEGGGGTWGGGEIPMGERGGREYSKVQIHYIIC